MVGKGTFFRGREPFQLGQRDPVHDHLVQTTAHQVRLAAEQPDEALILDGSRQWLAVKLIELAHLGWAEIVQPNPRADVEWRLIEVCDKKMRFRRVADHHGEPMPRAFRIQSARVMPRTEKPEQLATKWAGKEPVDLVERPNKWAAHTA